MINIAFYGSHNAAFAVERDGKIELVMELERIVNAKNQGIAQYKVYKSDDIIFFSKYLGEYLCKKFNIEQFDNCYYQNTDVNIDKVNYKLERNIPAKNYIHCLHHMSHAAGAFYQSPYNDALIFSFDGGGNDGFFNVYIARRGKGVQCIDVIRHPKSQSPHEFLDLGFPYMLMGHFLEDIRQETDISGGNLVYPGKMMGLASYGKVNEEWLPHFIEYFLTQMSGIAYKHVLKELGSKIGVTFSPDDRLGGEVGQNIAATLQRAFEEVFISYAKPYLDKYPDHPVCITGGCGLNIILNTRIKQEFKREVFVGPNPNDCGLAAGMLLHAMAPKDPIDLTYSGLELLDLELLPDYINEAHYCTSHALVIDDLVDDLIKGKIVGVARGKSEHGPRALGNRSILCNPAIKDMKDILNKKVKDREWYRPFAPVVRLEDVSKYFEFEGESRWMSFCPKVRKEYRKKLASVTHVDNTARIQTVTREQNEWLYDLLTEIDKKTGVGVLLNTSFNVNGKPILSTARDAFEIFWKTELDRLVIENYYFRKRDNEK